jgi:hypothetical protein
MLEKHNAIWVDFNDDNAAKIVHEVYSAELDKLFIVYQRKDGRYMPLVYVKKASHQWSLPFWTNENTKVLTASLEEAKNYLASYGANT